METSWIAITLLSDGGSIHTYTDLKLDNNQIDELVLSLKSWVDNDEIKEQKFYYGLESPVEGGTFYGKIKGFLLVTNSNQVGRGNNMYMSFKGLNHGSANTMEPFNVCPCHYDEFVQYCKAYIDSYSNSLDLDILNTETGERSVMYSKIGLELFSY